VERKFEIIREALNKLSTFDPELTQKINEYKTLIAFRNRVIHGYDTVDDRIVWDILQQKLPAIQGQVASMLGGE
jgi:uncharacterized protein with HEPN domain